MFYFSRQSSIEFRAHHDPIRAVVCVHRQPTFYQHSSRKIDASGCKSRGRFLGVRNYHFLSFYKTNLPHFKTDMLSPAKPTASASKPCYSTTTVGQTHLVPNTVSVLGRCGCIPLVGTTLLHLQHPCFVCVSRCASGGRRRQTIPASRAASHARQGTRKPFRTRPVDTLCRTLVLGRRALP